MTKLRNTPVVAIAVLMSSGLLALAGGGGMGGGRGGGGGGPENTVDFLARPTTAEKAPDAAGFIQRWLILDPINNAQGVSQNAVQRMVKTDLFPNQFTVIPKDGDKVTVNGAELTWHALDSKKYDFSLWHYALLTGKQTSANVLIWAVTIVNCPEEIKDVRLAIGSNDASVWWVNGQEVTGLYGDRPCVVDDAVTKKLTLKRGQNIIRAAIHNQQGMTDFCARFLDADGKPVTKFTTSVVDITR
jgi:hypothetical protein